MEVLWIPSGTCHWDTLVLHSLFFILVHIIEVFVSKSTFIEFVIVGSDTSNNGILNLWPLATDVRWLVIVTSTSSEILWKWNHIENLSIGMGVWFARKVEHSCSDSWLRLGPFQKFIWNVVLTLEWSTIIFFVTKSISTLDRIWLPCVTLIWFTQISHCTWLVWLTKRLDIYCRTSSYRTISSWLGHCWSYKQLSFPGIWRNDHWNQHKNLLRRIWGFPLGHWRPWLCQWLELMRVSSVSKF